MSEVFNLAFAKTNEIEGGYANHKKDIETKYGITLTTAREWGYTGAMKDLSLTLAKQIAKAWYWDEMNCEGIARLSVPVACEVYDTYFNTGSTWLQKCLNKLNANGTLFNELIVDGKHGPKTLSALATYIDYRGKQGETVLLRALNAYQCVYYFDIDKEDFVYGWLSNRVLI